MAPLNRRPVLAAILALTVLAVTAGCDDQPEDAAMTDGLLVLSGDVGSVALTVRENGGSTSRDIKLPDRGTSWVSAGRTNVLLATLVDGTTYVSNPLGEDDPEWRLVEPVTSRDTPPEPPLFFGTWDPPGGAYAQLGLDVNGRRGMRVVVVDPSLDQAVEVAASENAVPIPAAWIDDDRVVLAGAGERGETVIVDSATEEAEPGPAGAQYVATSADASTAAVWGGGGETIDVQSTADWLAGQPANVRIEAPAGAEAPIVMALDADGARLAVVWTDADNAPVTIAVYAATKDWDRVASLDVGDVTAAAVAWLR